MQGDVGAAPCIRSRRQIVCIDFTGHFENADCDALRHFGPAGEPFAIGPALQHRLGEFVALVSLVLDVVELVEHQQGFLQPFRGDGRNRLVVEQIHQRADVVAAQHGSQQSGRFFAADQGAFFAAMCNGGQVAGLDFCGIVHAGRNTVRDQFQQGHVFTQRTQRLRVLEQFNQIRGLFCRQRQRRNAERGAFGDMGTVGLQHG